MKPTTEQIISMNDFDNKQLNQRLAKMPKEYTVDDILDCDEKKNCITIKSIGENYHIHLKKIKNKGDLLDTVINLSRKNGMNMYLIGEFIERVEAMKLKTGW